MQGLRGVAGSKESDEENLSQSTSDEEDENDGSPRAKRPRRRQLPPRYTGVELSTLFVAALSVPDFVRQLARVDVLNVRGHGLVVRTLDLDSRDVASAAVAFAVHDTDMAPAWRALAEDCLGDIVPDNQAAAMYHALVRTAIKASRHPGMEPEFVPRGAARSMFDLTLQDLKVREGGEPKQHMLRAVGHAGAAQ